MILWLKTTSGLSAVDEMSFATGDSVCRNENTS